MTGQTHDLTMPAFGADMATGTLIEWQVKAGDRVQRGDVIAVIETNKGAIELDIFEDTVIEALLVQVGDEVRVGTSIARLSGAAPQSSRQPPAQEEPEPPTAAEREDLSSGSRQNQPGFILASPAARRWAVTNQVSLSEFVIDQNIPLTLKDLAPKGLTLKESESGKEPLSRPPAQASVSRDAKQMMRQAISDTVTLSKQTIPHYYLSHRLDITELQQFLSRYNRDKNPQERLLITAPLLTAVARLLLKFPQLNGQYINDQFQPQSSVHLAHAVNVRGEGLIMPVIREAQTFTAITMMQVISGQVAAARRGRLPMSQLTGASCCVSSVGERGAEQMWAIIQPPQVAMIALGSLHQQALVVDGQIQVRDVIVAGLSADHRVSDGHVGARFLYQLNQLLQTPEQLWTENN